MNMNYYIAAKAPLVRARGRHISQREVDPSLTAAIETTTQRSSAFINYPHKRPKIPHGQLLLTILEAALRVVNDTYEEDEAEQEGGKVQETSDAEPENQV